MKTFNSVKDAIEYSEKFDTIACVEYSETAKAKLESICDGKQVTRHSCIEQSEFEYWGDADNSNGCDGRMKWRVHIIKGA